MVHDQPSRRRRSSPMPTSSSSEKRPTPRSVLPASAHLQPSAARASAVEPVLPAVGTAAEPAPAFPAPTFPAPAEGIAPAALGVPATAPLAPLAPFDPAATPGAPPLVEP